MTPLELAEAFVDRYRIERRVVGAVWRPECSVLEVEFEDGDVLGVSYALLTELVPPKPRVSREQMELSILADLVKRRTVH